MAAAEDFVAPRDQGPALEQREEQRHATAAGTFDAIVIRPVIKTSGMLGEARKTEVWLSDDARRMVLQVRSDLPFGSVTMALREYDPGRGAARAVVADR